MTVGKSHEQMSKARKKKVITGDDKSNVYVPTQDYDIPERPIHLVQPRGLVDTLQNPGEQLCCQQFS